LLLGRGGLVVVRLAQFSRLQLLLLAEQCIVLELLCQRHQDAISVPGPVSWYASRPPAQCSLSAKISHLRDHSKSPFCEAARRLS
jgi:hypothetical protein